MKLFCYHPNCHLETEVTKPELNVLYNIEFKEQISNIASQGYSSHGLKGLYMMCGKFSNKPPSPSIIPVFSIYLLGWGSWKYLLVYNKTQWHHHMIHVTDYPFY